MQTRLREQESTPGKKLHHLLLPSAATPAADALFVDAGKSATIAPMVVW
jgi:hypothetical protein